MKTIEIPPCTSIDRACELAAATVRELKESVQFEFNSVVVVIHEGYTVDWAMEQYYRKHREKQEEAKKERTAALREAIANTEAMRQPEATESDIDEIMEAIKPFLRQ